MARRRLLTAVTLAVGSAAGSVILRKRRGRHSRPRRSLLRRRLDAVARSGLAGGRAAAAARLRGARGRRPRRVTREELARRLAERALLHGDFVLRSGRRSSVYLDKYRFETDPALLAPLAEALAAEAARVEPHATGSPGPSSAPCPW